MTLWKSALFRVNFEILSNRLWIPLDFRPVGIRFLHNPLPSGIVVFLRLPYLYRGTQRAYQVPLVVDSKGKYPSLLRWIFGLLHDWNAIQSFLSIVSLILRSTLISFNEDYKDSALAYTLPPFL